MTLMLKVFRNEPRVYSTNQNRRRPLKQGSEEILKVT